MIQNRYAIKILTGCPAGQVWSLGERFTQPLLKPNYFLTFQFIFELTVCTVLTSQKCEVDFCLKCKSVSPNTMMAVIIIARNTSSARSKH